jgi:hypothetical protein
MHYIVDKHDPEEANLEQAKLMLWLEVEQYIESAQDVPDCDYTDQAHRVLRKFFRPDSNFSLVLHVPSSVRAAMLTALALAEADTEEEQREGQGQGSVSPFQIYRDAQAWAAQDLQAGSFSKFTSSRMCARMCGHLRCGASDSCMLCHNVAVVLSALAVTARRALLTCDLASLLCPVMTCSPEILLPS